MEDQAVLASCLDGRVNNFGAEALIDRTVIGRGKYVSEVHIRFTESPGHGQALPPARWPRRACPDPLARVRPTCSPPSCVQGQRHSVSHLHGAGEHPSRGETVQQRPAERLQDSGHQEGGRYDGDHDPQAVRP